MKKIFKIFKITLISILALAIGAVLYFFIGNWLFIGFKDRENIGYLARNNVGVTDSIDGKLFDSDFYGSNVFLLGEIHGYADNQKLDRELFLFLNKRLGVRYYVAEMDSTTAGKLVPAKHSNTTDYFQYVFLLSNSKALSKLN